jgi:hypothetical protein
VRLNLDNEGEFWDIGFRSGVGIMMESGCICIDGVMEDTLVIINFII